MSETVMVPFSHLVLLHREIGIHRGRKWGFRDVFGFRTLRDVPFVALASKVKDAYKGRDVPPHDGWPAQHEALRWLVDKGHDGIYALDELGIKLITSADVLEARRIKLASRLDALGPASPLDPSQIALSTEEGIRLANSPDDALDEGICIAGGPEHFYLSDGHHRALALYILGEDEVRARILSSSRVKLCTVEGFP